MVGGIGSGKSWVGSYDLIRRGKPGRLYMVVAPTFGMLADSTFRMFLQIAGELGVVDPADVRKSAPPSVRLLTGAEVLFRSADDADRLRGPNLTGIWLDEASLMTQDVFTIAIGRLREGSEQGWLSATFTPKGKSHWSYDVFRQRPARHRPLPRQDGRQPILATAVRRNDPQAVHQRPRRAGVGRRVR